MLRFSTTVLIFAVPHCAITKLSETRLRLCQSQRYNAFTLLFYAVLCFASAMRFDAVQLLYLVSHNNALAELLFNGKDFESSVSSVSPLAESGISSVCKPFSDCLFIRIRHNRDNKGYA